ncbi:hypothetical protein RclHR1_18750004 [Rhizophagus clarus]|uniref:Endonuclease/exonuclease/phosphatase domain-containing protein n=1 Tax=Rhizophagus clarus TaxID=94130 RepID=A0A2Z6QS47_9GLOM|nr:hypothetical protein RclHR1_18750004 [Rhizophagus clarus]
MMNLNNNNTLIIDNPSHSFDTYTSHPIPRPFINLDDEYNSLTYTSDDQSDYLKIGTINIQGAYQSKIDNIILYFTTYNFDILTLTETGLHTPHTHNNIQIINHPDNKSKLYIIHDINGKHKGTGVAIILSKKLFKHFITCTFLNGRLLHITLKFKPHISLNIIAAYLPTNPSSNHHHDSRSIYYTKLLQIINLIISTDKSHTIILGDFNTDLDSINNRSSTDSNFKFMKLLRSFQFYDLSEHHNLSQDKPLSHIILISKHSKSKSQTNSQTRTYIPYKHLSAKCWEPYKEASKSAFDQINITADTPKILLDKLWEDFSDTISEIKENCLPKRKRPLDPTLPPLKIRQLYNNIFKLQNIKQIFNTSRIKKIICFTNNLDPNSFQDITLIPDVKWMEYFTRNWTHQRFLLNLTHKLNKYNSNQINFTWPKVITKHNYTDV